MPKVDKYISELLFDHDCVIVPDFGGFVGNNMPASIKKAGKTLQPPYKQISFNQSLKRNDGLLINHLAESEKKDYNSATSVVAGFTKLANEKLKKDKELLLEDIGTLYYDSHNKLRFQQDYSVNYLKEAFGLASVQVKQVARREDTEKTTISRTKKQDKPPVRTTRKSKAKSTALYVAAALPIIAYLVWLPLKTDILKSNGNFHYSDLNPFAEKVCAEYSKRNNTMQVLDNITEEYFNLHAAEGDYAKIYFTETKEGYSPVIVKLTESPAVAESTHVETTKPKNNNRFHVIGGCFSVLQNAKRFVENLGSKGFQSHIVDKHKGLNRVSVQSFATREEAVKKLREIRQSVNNNAWLLIK